MTIPIQILKKKYHSGIQKWTLKRKRWNQPVATAEAAAPSGPGETSLVWSHRFPIFPVAHTDPEEFRGTCFRCRFPLQTSFPE